MHVLVALNDRPVAVQRRRARVPLRVLFGMCRVCVCAKIRTTSRASLVGEFDAITRCITKNVCTPTARCAAAGSAPAPPAGAATVTAASCFAPPAASAASATTAALPLPCLGAGFLGDCDMSRTMVVQVLVISCVPLFTWCVGVWCKERRRRTRLKWSGLRMERLSGKHLFLFSHRPNRLTTLTVVWFLSTGAAGSLPLAAAGACGCSVIVTGGACVGGDGGSVALGAATGTEGLVVVVVGAGGVVSTAGVAGGTAGGCVFGVVCVRARGGFHVSSYQQNNNA